MKSRVCLGLSLVPFLAALLVSGCKTVEKDGDLPDAMALPVASVATADPLPAAATAAPTVVVPTPTPVTTPTTAKLDAGAPSDAGAPKIVDAGAAAANGTFKACAEKCQAVLAGCAIPQIPKDGGLPQLKDPVACQAAANACVAACTP